MLTEAYLCTNEFFNWLLIWTFFTIIIFIVFDDSYWNFSCVSILYSCYWKSNNIRKPGKNSGTMSWIHKTMEWKLEFYLNLIIRLKYGPIGRLYVNPESNEMKTRSKNIGISLNISMRYMRKRKHILPLVFVVTTSIEKCLKFFFLSISIRGARIWLSNKL